MDSLKNFTSEQLIERYMLYYDRVKILMDSISKYIDTKIGDTEQIKAEYAELKEAFSEEYKYFSAEKNEIMYISQVHNCYQSAIMEAVAKGFSVKKGSAVNQKLLNSVYDAEYYISYYMKKYMK